MFELKSVDLSLAGTGSKADIRSKDGATRLEAIRGIRQSQRHVLLLVAVKDDCFSLKA